MSSTLLADPGTAPTAVDDDFVLDLRVIESAVPIAALRCDTSDGCGNTCSTSACNSNANNPF